MIQKNKLKGVKLIDIDIRILMAALSNTIDTTVAALLMLMILIGILIIMTVMILIVIYTLEINCKTFTLDFHLIIMI